MTQAIQFEKFGDFKEVLKYNNNIPKPQIESDSQLIVKVSAASINPSDLNTISGTYGIKPKSFPATPGFEGAGVIVEVGKDVSNYQVGQKVHIQKAGTWAEFVVLDTKTDHLIPLPEQISEFEGAQLTVNPLSAAAMIDELEIKDNSGDFLLQSGAASSLGRIIIQLAKLKGFKTINVVRRNEQIEELKAIGADYVINSEVDDISEKVKEITQNAGVKCAIDCVGGTVGSLVAKSLGVDGVLLIYGRLSPDPFTIQSGAMIFKRTVIKGFWLVGWLQKNSAKVKPTYAELIKYIASKQLALPYKTFPVSEFQAALAHCQTPGKSEKTLLTF